MSPWKKKMVSKFENWVCRYAPNLRFFFNEEKDDKRSNLGVLYPFFRQPQFVVRRNWWTNVELLFHWCYTANNEHALDEEMVCSLKSLLNHRSWVRDDRDATISLAAAMRGQQATSEQFMLYVSIWEFGKCCGFRFEFDILGLVGGLEHVLCSIQLGMSSSQLTNSMILQRVQITNQIIIPLLTTIKPLLTIINHQPPTSCHESS